MLSLKWRNKKLISKRLTLGRLETSDEFKETKPKIVKKDEEIESLKIAVRELNDQDISSRNLDKKTKGLVITEISTRSPFANLVSVNDIIIEVQKTPIKSIGDLKKIVNNIFKKGEKTLLLKIINQNNDLVIFWATHSLAELDDWCSRVIMLDRGSIEEDISSEKVDNFSNYF